MQGQIICYAIDMFDNCSEIQVYNGLRLDIGRKISGGLFGKFSGHCKGKESRRIHSAR